MSYRALSEALLQGKPYLGPALRAMQGPPERHRYFRPLLKVAAELLPFPLAILEIGSWAGASAISWGIALKDLKLEGDITCVDPWLPYFDTNIDTLPVYREMNSAAERKLICRLFQHNIAAAGVRDMIRIEQGSSQKVLPRLSDHSYAIVYIDGAHSYKDVLSDLQEAKRLLRDGGIICGDDLELESGQIDPAELSAAVESGQDFVLSAKAGRYYHPGVTAAVDEVIGAVSVWEGFWAVRFYDGRWEQVTLDLALAVLPSHVVPFLHRIEGQTAGYDLYSQDGRFFAVSPDVPQGFMDEWLVGSDLPPLVFVGGTLEEVAQKVTAATNETTPDTFEQPRIIDSHRSFNIVRLRDSFYGLRQSVGEVDLSLCEDTLGTQYGEQNFVVATSVDGVKARIDCIEMSRDFKQLAEKISSLSNDIGLMRFGSKPEGGSRVEENYAGFKLISHQDRIYAFRTSLGSIDLDLGDEVLRQRYGARDLVIGSSVEAVRVQINILESMARLQDEVEVLRNCTTNPDWLDELRSSIQQLSAQLQQAIDHASRIAREYTVQAASNLQAQFSRELAQEREQTQALVQGVERLEVKINQVGIASEQAVASLKTQIATLGLRGLWRKWFSADSGRKVLGD